MALFKNPVCETTQALTEHEFDLVYLGRMYAKFLTQYFNTKTTFPVKKGSKQHEKQITQLKKLLGIIQELNVDPEHYIKAQFEVLYPWVKKSKFRYITIYMLTSDNAKDRWFKWLDRIDNQNELKKDKVTVQYARTLIDNTRQIIFRSIKNFYKVIAWYQDKNLLDRPTALKQLEICHKAGDVDSMYVYINPMMKPLCENEHLKAVWKEQDKKLNKKYKDWLQRLFEETRPVVEERGVEKYV